MLKVVKASRWVKCASCGEQIRTDERMIIAVKEDGETPIRGEKYCMGCQEIAEENNPSDDYDYTSHNEDGNLRDRENYAAYQYAGCTSAYWEDRDAGYV